MPSDIWTLYSCRWTSHELKNIQVVDHSKEFQCKIKHGWNDSYGSWVTIESEAFLMLKNNEGLHEWLQYVPDKHHKKHVSNPPQIIKIEGKTTVFHNATRNPQYSGIQTEANTTEIKLCISSSGSWTLRCHRLAPCSCDGAVNHPFLWLLGRRWVSVRHENMSNIHGTLQKQYQNERRHCRSDEQAYSFLVTCSTLPVFFAASKAFVLDVAPRRSSSLFHGHQLNRPEEYPKHRRRDTAKGWWGARNQHHFYDVSGKSLKKLPYVFSYAISETLHFYLGKLLLKKKKVPC